MNLYLTEVNANLMLIIAYYVSNLLHIIAIYYVHRVNLTKLFIVANILSLVVQGVSAIISFFFVLFQSSYLSGIQVNPWIVSTINMFIIIPTAFGLCIVLLMKLKLKEFVNASLYSKKSSIAMFVVCLILPSVLFNVNLLDSFIANYFGLRIPVLSILVILIEFIIICYLSANGMSRMKIQSLETTTQQQQIYVQELEQMQQKVRIFRHDYKNMMASIYIQTQEGQVDKIAEFIEKSVINFDFKIGNKIKRSTQLQNIQIIEVKSLLLTKLMLMNDKGINCKIEVIYPLKEVNMTLDEFIICLGILIDNAIEAVEKMDKPEVQILISEQKTCLTVIISNNILNDVECHDLYKYGYSTKGNNRGVGLFRYKQLTNKYVNIATSTSCNNGVFVQELKIRGK